MHIFYLTLKLHRCNSLNSLWNILQLLFFFTFFLENLCRICLHSANCATRFAFRQLSQSNEYEYIYSRHIYVNMLSDICAVLIEISRVNWSCYWISNFMRLQISHALTSLVTRDESKSEYIKCIKYTLESSGPLWLGSAWVSCNWLLFSLSSSFLTCTIVCDLINGFAVSDWNWTLLSLQQR